MQQGKQDVGEMIVEEGTLADQSEALSTSGSARKLCTWTKHEMKARDPAEQDYLYNLL